MNKLRDLLITRNRFRWAACQLDALGRCLNRSMLRKSLKELPRTLDETYERILCAIDDDYHEYALRILQWLAFSTRPLFVGELAEAVAISGDDSPLFDRDQVLGDPFDVLTICPSLVTVVSIPMIGPMPKAFAEKGITYQHEMFTLAHYSVKEYLLSKRIQQSPAAAYSIQEGAANTFLANSCLAYLLQFQEPDCINVATLDKSKLTLYAAEFWVHHARAAKQDTGVMYQMIMKLFSPTNNGFRNWIRIWDLDRPWSGADPTGSLNDVPTPLYYASLTGLPKVVQLLALKANVDVNMRGGFHGSPLHAASYRGHVEMVKLLLEMGADVNLQGGFYGTALQAACAHSRAEVVRQLLEAGADVNAQGGRYGNALQAAAACGSSKIVQQLIDAGADVKMQGGFWGSALHAASGHGHCEVIRQLLDAGADINAHSELHGSVLHAAVCYAFEETAVEQIIDVNPLLSEERDNAPRAAAAATCCGRDVIDQLLEAGANVNAQGGQYGTALQAASAQGYEKIVTRLLEAGADVNAKSGCYGNALQAACARGHDIVVKLLLEAGADVNAQGGMLGTPLKAASIQSDEKLLIIKRLLEAGADVNAGGKYGTALHAACAEVKEKVLTVKLLLEAGADVNAQGATYGTALQAACYRGHDAVVKLLLDAGADVNAEGGEYGNALRAAKANGHEKIVHLLLDAGANAERAA